MNRIVVFSDLHLSTGDLAVFNAGDELASALRANAGENVTIVLAGDVLDLLQQLDHAAHLDLPASPGLVRTALDEVRKTRWGRPLLEALSAHLGEGGECVLIPGNHDLELFHPHARGVWLAALELPESARMSVFTGAGPWSASVGRLAVQVLHGHRGDPWNDLPHERIMRALASGDRCTPLPPGSQLVLDVLNPFKLAVDPKTGRRRFPFVDLLKPELPAVPLLLLYLDPELVLRRLAQLVGPLGQVLVRAFDTALRRALGNVVLGGETEPNGTTDAEGLAATIAAALVAELPSDLRAAPRMARARFEETLRGAEAPITGTLSAHEGLRPYLLRAALKRLSREGTLFDTEALSEEDRSIFEPLIKTAAEPTVVIAGHTHAARISRIGDHTYVNTGTWIDLMEFPPFDLDADLRAWIDRLEEGRVQRCRRLTYAEVTLDGASLRTWSS